MTVVSAPVTTIYAARKGSRALTAEDLWKLPRVGAPAPAPDGNAIAVPVTTWDLEKNESRTRIWWVPADGSAPRPLTSEEYTSSEPSVSPDGTQLAFIRKKEKGKGQLHVMPLNGGEPRQLTNLPLGAFDPRWLPSGSGLVFAAYLIKGHLAPEATAAELERREKDPVKAHITEERMYRHWDQWLTTGEVPHLFHYDLATETLRDLTPESTVWFDWMEPSGQFDVSPDGSEVAFSGITQLEGAKAPRSAIYTVPVAGGSVTCLTLDHPADDMRPRYAPDGKTLVYGMTQDPEFYADRVRLMVFDRATRTHSSPVPDWKLSPSHWGFAGDGTLILEAEEDARASLFSWKPGPTEPKRIVRGGSITGSQPARGAIYYNQQTLMDAPEVHRAAPDGSGAKRLTTFTEPIARTLALGEVREMYFEGAYGERVHMYVVLPPHYEEGKKYPLVHVIHGGPHGISGDAFHFRWNGQLFAAPGYVAAMVNFQGSTSWGQDFAQRILGSWGDRPYQDVMLATDHLIASGLVDENRMAASGGSYGGYMAAWIAGHTDRFKCIINHAGVYDTLSQYASDWTFGRNRAFGGEPWNGLEAIDAYNPARFAAGFKTPMLVIHGERDYRVPVTQGLECYGVLKAKGIPARLVYFPDENHWVLKARNSLVWYREVHAWLERWLGK